MKLRYNPFLALLAIAPVAPAADYYYDANGNTSTAVGGTGNWSGSVWRDGSTTGTLGSWVDGNTARFSATSIVTLDQNAAPAGINFGGINCDIRGSGANALTFSGGIITNSATTSGFQGHDLTGLLAGSVIFNPTSGNLAGASTFVVKANNTGLTSVELKAETTTLPITALPNANMIIDDVGALGPATTSVKLTSGVLNIGALTTQQIGSATNNGSGGSLNLNAWNTELAGGVIRSRVGANTWNGPVSVTANSGLLTRPAAGVKLTLAGNINLNANTLTLSPTSPSDGIVLSGNISGSGGGITQANSALTSAGTAAATTTSTISGTNTYTGPTQINVGRLNLTGSLTSNLTMATGTTLTGEGSTTGSLNFGTTNDFFLDPNTPATHFQAGSINASTSTVAIKLTGPSPVVTDMVVMESTGGPINGLISNFTFTGRGSLSFNPGGTQLLFTYTPATLIWKGNDVTNPTFWDGATLNWLNGGSPDAFQTNDLVVFNDTATSFNVAVQGATIEPGSITFDNSTNDYTLGGSPIIGSGTFTKNGTAKVTVTTNNTFTGLATINAGTVALGDGSGIAGSLGTNPALTNNGALETNFNAARIIDQVIGGTGSFTQKGVGAVTLAVDNTYSGGTTIDSGATLQIGNGGLFGSVVGNIVTNGTLTFNRGDGGTFANNISGSGGIFKALNTGATATLTGNNTFDGPVEITNGSLVAGSNTALGSTVGETTISASGGRLELANGVTITGETINVFGSGALFNGSLMAQANATATWAGPVVLASTDARLGAAAGGTLIVSGSISDGVGTALNIGAGTGGSATVRISGSTKTYGGATNIVRGTLQLGASNVLPAGTTLDVDNANAAENSIFDLNGFTPGGAALPRTSAGGGAGAGIVTNTSGTPSTLTLTQAAPTTYSGRITGNLALVHNGAGTLTLSGTQVDHLRNTTVNGGITIAAGSQITLTPTTNGVTNSIGGSGTLTLDGKLTLNLATTDATHGNSWNLINTGTLTEIYNPTTFSVNSSLGAFTESIATPGTWKLVNGINEWTFVESSGVLSVGPISDPFTPWIDSFFPAETNPAIIGKTADPDNDGVDNLTEFALNGDPDDGSNNGLTTLVLQDTAAPAGNELTLVAAVRDGASFSAAGTTQTATLDGVVYTIEGSLDLAFSPGSAVTTVGSGSEAAPAGTSLPAITGSAWEYRTFRLDASEGLSGKGFLRAKIEAAP
jgi:autotransporter-associated beta strand protein